jgi:hypothetical protein
MSLRGIAGTATLGAALLLAGCNSKTADDNSLDNIVPLGNAAAPVQEVAPDGSAIADATPMQERVAVIGLLNKRNGVAQEVTMKPGEAKRLGDVVIRLRACEKTAPWELAQSTGAFVQVDVLGGDKKWRRVFSGWLFAERPADNVVQHPIYDVWTKSCAMTFKDSGPETVSAGAGPKGSDSSAKKSPSTAGAPKAKPPAESPSAAPSNAT